MKSAGRTLLAVVAGMALAFALVVAVEWFSSVVHPFPAGFNGNMGEHVRRYPHWVLGVVVLAWGATAAAATWVAPRVGGRLAGIVVALLLAWALIFNLTMLPYVTWFKATLASLPRSAQQPPTFRSGTTLIEVDVIVKDKAGRFVDDLSAADFTLSDEGAAQAVETFYVVRGPQAAADAARRQAWVAPTTAALSPEAVQRIFILWFDVEHIAVGGVVRAKKAAAAFLDADFADGDVGGVLAGGTMVNARLTGSNEELRAAIDGVQPAFHVRSRELDMRAWPRIVSLFEAVGIDRGDDRVIGHVVSRACADDPDHKGDDPRPQILLKGRSMVADVRNSALRTLDTLNQVVARLAPFTGRKTIVYLSDGFFSEDLSGQMQAVIGRAARANVRIYALDTRGLNRGSADSSILDAPPQERTYNTVTGRGAGLAAEMPLFDIGADGPNSLAVDTGGLAIRNENDFQKALHEIANDTSSYYVLGYRPTAGNEDGKFHRITVTVRREGLSVRARKGHIALAAPTAPVNAPAAGADYPDRAGQPVVPGAAPPAPPPPATPSLPPVGTVADKDVTPALAALTGSAVDPTAIRLRPSAGSAASDAARLRDEVRTAPAGTEPMPAVLMEQARKGWDAYQRGDTKTAWSFLSAPADHLAAPPWVPYVLGWSAFAEGNYVAARNAWNVVRTAVPGFQPVYFDIADAYLRQRRFGEALVMLRNAERRWPANADVLNALGTVQMAMGELGDAVASFGRAREAAPGDVTSEFNLAAAKEARYVRSVRETTLRVGDRADALDGYRHVMQVDGPLAAPAGRGVRRLESIDARKAKCSRPVRLASISQQMLHGRPARLAWSPEGRQIYVWGYTQVSTAEGHVLAAVADGSVSQAASAPAWAQHYWLWKAARSAPWLPTLALTSSTTFRTAYNTIDPGNPSRAFAPATGQTATNVLTLHSEVVAEASGSLVMPGLTFGWSPFAMGAIAFATPSGRLVIMDCEARKLNVEGTRNVLLPAWSEDGSRIAYLAPQGNDYVLYLVDLTF